jgi:hypothetical protein
MIAALTGPIEDAIDLPPKGGRVMNTTTMTVYPYGTDEPGVTLTGTGYAVRCASHIAYENLPDARWALEVLNRYGHLVQHAADRLKAEAGGTRGRECRITQHPESAHLYSSGNHGRRLFRLQSADRSVDELQGVIR